MLIYFDDVTIYYIYTYIYNLHCHTKNERKSVLMSLVECVTHNFLESVLF